MSPPLAENIVLVGFMGTGKSSLASSLARQTGAPVMDTDREIEKTFGRSTSAIFLEEGEDFFRNAETSFLENNHQKTGFIISTGGGMVVRPENRAILRNLGLVVWLSASEEVIFERVSRNDRRPLLQTANPRETLQQLLAAREEWYREVAHLEVNTGELSRSDVVKIVLEKAGWPCKRP